MNNSVHLIHIGDRKEMHRAIELFLNVPETWASFPGDVLGVSARHIEALQGATPPIAFEPATKGHLNGQNSTVRSK